MLKPNLVPTLLSVSVLAATPLGPANVARAQADPANAAIRIVMVAGALSDPFFGALKKGADDAAQNLGITFTYLPSDISGPALAKALVAATASKPSAIAAGDWYPSAQDPLITQATKSGIPVVVVNAAAPNWASTGAMAFVGESDEEAGYVAGKQLGMAGVQHALFVNQAPGAQNLEQASAGFARAIKEAGGTSSVVNIPYSDSNDPGRVTQDIQGVLTSDQKIDGIFTFGAAIAQDAVRAVKLAGRSGTIKVAGHNVSNAVLQEIQSGELLFTIDQQPYLQGYYAVLVLAQDVKYGMHLVGQVSTGPVIIGKEGLDKVITVNNTYRGILGAL